MPAGVAVQRPAVDTSAGDIVGGVREALIVLAEHARAPKVHHVDEPF